MAETNKSRHVISHRAWAGLVSNADPNDIPDGALQDCQNVVVVRAGELSVRKGFRPVTFEN